MVKQLWIDIGEGKNSNEALEAALGAAKQRPGCQILCHYRVDDVAHDAVTVSIQVKQNTQLKSAVKYSRGKYAHIVISEAN